LPGAGLHHGHNRDGNSIDAGSNRVVSLRTIQPDITELGSTSIDPTLTMVPTPNSAVCSESVTMSLANPGMMAPANATGATATSGVSSASGC
jgi:hypothetical protein